MSALRPLRRAQWRRPSSLMSPTDEDAAEDVADEAPDADGADAENAAPAHRADMVALEPLQPTGAAPNRPAPRRSASCQN